MRLFVLSFLCVFHLFAWPAMAAPVANLYQVREPVAEQGSQNREAAMQKALDTLILRLTGAPAVDSGQALEALRKDPQQIIRRYGYEGNALVVEFDPLSTERKLREAGLPLWGENRPLILSWWLSETVNGIQLMSESQSVDYLQHAAQHRGLPIQLPLADLDEQLLATPAVFTADDPQALRNASERYDADVLLVVYAVEANGAWKAHWRSWLGERRLEQGAVTAATQEELADAIFMAISTRLAPYFVSRPGATEELRLVVSNVDLARYAVLENMLEPLAGRLQSVTDDQVVYLVKASAEQLRAQLKLARLQEEPVIVPAAEEGAEAVPVPVPDNELRFRW